MDLGVNFLNINYSFLYHTLFFRVINKISKIFFVFTHLSVVEVHILITIKNLIFLTII